MSNGPTPLFLCVFQLSLGDEQCEVTRNGYESKELVYLVHIYCQVRQRTPRGLMVQSYRNTHICLTSNSMHRLGYDYIQTSTQTPLHLQTHTHTHTHICIKGLMRSTFLYKLVRGDFQPTNGGSVQPVQISSAVLPVSRTLAHSQTFLKHLTYCLKNPSYVGIWN